MNSIFFSFNYHMNKINLLTEDGRSINVFSVYWQLSQGRMANFLAFIASKSFNL